MEHHHLQEEEEDDEIVDHFEPASPGQKGKRKEPGSGRVYRKAPQAPKRFKSSYICFFMAKQNEIKEELGEAASVTAVSRRSAEIWYVERAFASFVLASTNRLTTSLSPTVDDSS